MAENWREAARVKHVRFHGGNESVKVKGKGGKEKGRVSSRRPRMGGESLFAEAKEMASSSMRRWTQSSTTAVGSSCRGFRSVGPSFLRPMGVKGGKLGERAGRLTVAGPSCEP